MNMKISFYQTQSNRCPVKEFIDELQPRDRAKVLACLKSVEELGFNCPRVQFRQIKGHLWEIKIKSASAGFRIFYVAAKGDNIVLLHSYQKQTDKAPVREIEVAEKRMIEVLKHEKNYTG